MQVLIPLMYCCADGTFDGNLEYKVSDTDDFVVITPADVKGYDGGKYECKEERTCKFMENLAEKEL